MQGPNRFAERGKLLTGAHQEVWQTWRRDELTRFYQRLAEQLQQQRADLTITICTESALDGVLPRREVRKAVAGRGSFATAFAMAGLDVPALCSSEGIVVLRPHRVGSTRSGEQCAIDQHAGDAGSLAALFAADRGSGALFYHSPAYLRLPTFDAQSPFGTDKTSLTLSLTPMAAGAEARRRLVSTVASSDPVHLIEGSGVWLIADDPVRRRLLKTLAALPVSAQEVRMHPGQPVSLRTYRDQQATTACFMNESPWPVRAEVTIDCQTTAAFQRLGDPVDSPAPAPLAPGKQNWTIELAPYDLQAWQIADPRVRIDPPQLEGNDLARDELERRIGSLDARMQNIDIRRSYSQLLDPGFELSGAGNSSAWESRRGGAGEVTFDAPGRTGDYAMRLTSQDALGVAAQSQLFPAPETGLLVLRAVARSNGPSENVQLHVSVDYDEQGQPKRRFRTFGGEQLLSQQWTTLELAVDDIPLDEDAEMRVQFHTTGKGEVWVDDVELLDLEFSSDQRIELAKRVYAAKTALAEGKVLDCLRQVDSYWPRRLVEHVPPIQLAAAPPTRKSAPEPATEEESTKRWFPRLWR